MTALSLKDFNTVSALRYRFKWEIDHVSDQELIDEYAAFRASDMAGNNDELFLTWLQNRVGP